MVEAREGTRPHRDDEAATDTPTPRRGSVLRAAGLVSLLTLASRVLGLVRDVFTTAIFGRGAVLDTFVIAWMLPNMMRRLFGEGALAASLVPAYTRSLEGSEGPSRARRLLAGVSGGLAAFLGLLALAVVLGALLLPPELFGVGPARGRLLAELLAILFPYVVPVCLVAAFTGALQALGSFAPGALAPVILNLFWIAALWWCHGSDDLTGTARTMSFALLSGGMVQLAVVVMALIRRRAMPRPRLPRPDDGSGAVFRAMIPTAVGLSAVQLNVLIDQALAYWVVGEGAGSAMFLANRLLLFPHALVALPLATAVFPSLARDASTSDLQGLRSRLDAALSATLFLSFPAAIGMVLIADDLIAIAFEHGRFEGDDTRVTGWTTAALCSSLPAIGIAQLRARALYALDLPRVPARIAFRLLGVNLVLNLGLAVGLGLGPAGLALATAICSWINAWALGTACRSRLPAAGRLGIPAGTVRTLVASAAMAGAVLGVQALVPRDPAAGSLSLAWTRLALPIACGVLVHVGVHHGLGGEETRLLWTRVRRKLPGGGH